MLIRALLCILCLLWTPLDALASTKIRFLNGIQNDRNQTWENHNALRQAYSQQRTGTMPQLSADAFGWYYNPEGRFVDDAIEVALDASLKGIADSLASREVEFQRLRALIDGLTFSQNDISRIQTVTADRWHRYLVNVHLLTKGLGGSVKTASVLADLLVRLRADMSDGSTIVLVAHSQGTLFAEQMWAVLSDYERTRVKFVLVGSIASTSPSGRHFTLAADLVVNDLYGVALRAITPFAPAQLASNLPGYYVGPEGIASFWSFLGSVLNLVNPCALRSIRCVEAAGHGFATVYLNPQVDVSETDLTAVARKIVGAIGDSIAELDAAPSSRAPTVSISASPSSTTGSQPSTLTWSSSDTSSCTASGGWSGSKAASGSTSVAPTATTIYTLSCTGSGGTASSSATVTVAAVVAPTVSLSANPNTIAPGQSSTLTWSSANTLSCAASGGWGGNKSASGSTSVVPTATTIYTLSCTGSGGTASSSATVSVAAVIAPTVSISANPTATTPGQSSTLTWSSANTTSCTASGGWIGSKAASGSTSVVPTATTIYTLSCTGSGGTASSSATVSVAAVIAPTVSISANPTAIAPGQASILTWSSANTTSCTASGGWSGGKPASGITSVTPTATTTYTLNCTGSGGSISSSAILTVFDPNARLVTVTATGTINSIVPDPGRTTALNDVIPGGIAIGTPFVLTYTIDNSTMRSQASDGGAVYWNSVTIATVVISGRSIDLGDPTNDWLYFSPSGNRFYSQGGVAPALSFWNESSSPTTIFFSQNQSNLIQTALSAVANSSIPNVVGFSIGQGNARGAVTNFSITTTP